MRALRIDEVSAVDRGAGEGVKVVLVKRDDAGPPDDKKTQTDPNDRDSHPGSARGLTPTEQRRRAVLAAHERVHGADEKMRSDKRAKAPSDTNLTSEAWSMTKSWDEAITDKFVKNAAEADAVKPAEFTEPMLTEVSEAIKALRESVGTIIEDTSLVDKREAIEVTFGQFNSHVQGFVPAGVEKAMVAAGVFAAAMKETTDVKKSDTDVKKDDMDDDADDKKKGAKDDDADATKKAAEAAEVAKAAILAYRKLSDAHRAYVDSDESDMADADVQKFVAMTDAERDALVKASPLKDKAEKRYAKLPEHVRKSIEAGQLAMEKVAKLEEERELIDFGKRATALALPEAEFAKHLRAIVKAAPEAAEAVLKELSARTTQAREAGLFKEFGATGTGAVGGTALEQLESLAAEAKKADTKITKEQAFAKVYADPANRELVAQSKREQFRVA